MRVFVDSSAFIAYYNIKDKHHEKAVELLNNAFAKRLAYVYTSDYVLDESVTVTWAKTKDKKKAIKLGERLLYSEIKLLVVTEPIIEKTWQLYKKIENPSFTDCTTVVVMQENGIEDIITFDRGFKKIKGLNVMD